MPVAWLSIKIVLYSAHATRAVNSTIIDMWHTHETYKHVHEFATVLTSAQDGHICSTWVNYSLVLINYKNQFLVGSPRVLFHSAFGSCVCSLFTICINCLLINCLGGFKLSLPILVTIGRE